jgi:hypothetical protein
MNTDQNVEPEAGAIFATRNGSQFSCLRSFVFVCGKKRFCGPAPVSWSVSRFLRQPRTRTRNSAVRPLAIAADLPSQWMPLTRANAWSAFG